MFYGTISSIGTIDTAFSFSNNFSVSRSGTGTYVITFQEWMGTKPMLVVTPSTNDPDSCHSAAYTVGTLSDGRYQATVTSITTRTGKTKRLGSRRGSATRWPSTRARIPR